MENLTEKEFHLSFNEIYIDIIEKKKKSINKKAFILGGQPGAGKSGLTRLIEENNEVIVINGDEFRKAHPYYLELKEKYGDDYVKYTSEFSGKVTEKLINKLSDEGYNLVIEGTLRTSDVPIKTANILKDKGYEVELHLIQVRPELSLLGTFMRYEEMLEVGTVARGTPLEHHNQVVEKIPGNIDVIYNKKIFDNIEIYNRPGQKLYSLKETPELNPKDFFEKEFNRKLTNEEFKYLNEKYNEVLDSMNKRNAPLKQIKIVEQQKNNINKKKFKWSNKSNEDLER